MPRLAASILAASFAITAAIMWLSFADAGDSTIAMRLMFFAVTLSLAALGLAAVAYRADRYSWGRRLLASYWWGGRILAFMAGIVFSLLAALLPGMNLTDPNWLVVLGSFAIFFGFGLPLLMYALWGSSWGPLGTDSDQSRIGTWDLLLFRIRLVSYVLALLVFVGLALYRAR